MTPFRFVLLALTCYLGQRIVTTDNWWPSAWFRDALHRRAEAQDDEPGDDVASHPMPNAGWRYVYEFFTCSHCFGAILTFALVALDEYVWRFPTALLVAGAAAAIVGQIGQRDD